MATLVCFMAESLVDLRKPHNIRVMSLSFIHELKTVAWETATQWLRRSQFIYDFFWLGNTFSQSHIVVKDCC